MSTIKRYIDSTFLLSRSPKNRAIHALIFTVLGSLFFIIFKPFGFNDWFSNEGIFRYLNLLRFTLVGAAVDTILVYALFGYTLPKDLSSLKGVAWSIFNALVVSSVLTSIYSDPDAPFLDEFIDITMYTLPTVVLLYTISFLVLALLSRDSVIESRLEVREQNSVEEELLISIKDSKGDVKVQVNPTNLYLIESSGNYVKIFIDRDGSIIEVLVRTTLKLLEEQTNMYDNIVRCHRGYIVNIYKVTLLQKEGRGHILTLLGVDTPVPVSKGYITEVKNILNR